MSLMIFHLVLSTFTSDGIDVSMAAKIVEWNLKRYPNGAARLFPYLRLSHVISQACSSSLARAVSRSCARSHAGRSSCTNAHARRRISIATCTTFRFGRLRARNLLSGSPKRRS
jgi:uncharacterized protein (DUF924 family)